MLWVTHRTHGHTNRKTACAVVYIVCYENKELTEKEKIRLSLLGGMNKR